MQQRVFESFMQHNLCDSRVAGMGHAITRNFVRLMDGGIELKSIVGKGALFRFSLPIGLKS